jgi:hypothetical protein
MRMAPERSSANWATRWMAAGELAGADDGELGVVARHDGLEVGELAGELAAAEGAMADAEEEGVLVVGEFDLLGVGGEQLLQLLSALRGMRTRFSPLMPSSVSLGFSTKARRWPSVATMAMDSALRPAGRR